MNTTDLSRLHTLCGLSFAIVGMLLGIEMASSGDHVQHVTHAHVLLLGVVRSLLYGMVYRLWIPPGRSSLAMLQFAAHQLGTLGVAAGLFALYGQVLPEPAVGPALGVASVVVLAGAVLMLAVFVRAGYAAAEPAGRPASGEGYLL